MYYTNGFLNGERVWVEELGKGENNEFTWDNGSYKCSIDSNYEIISSRSCNWKDRNLNVFYTKFGYSIALLDQDDPNVTRTKVSIKSKDFVKDDDGEKYHYLKDNIVWVWHSKKVPLKPRKHFTMVRDALIERYNLTKKFTSMEIIGDNPLFDKWEEFHLQNLLSQSCPQVRGLGARQWEDYFNKNKLSFHPNTSIKYVDEHGGVDREW